MVYDAFLTQITEALQSRLGNDYRILLQKIPKNNGALLDGLCISKLSDRIAPTIYLRDYYEHFNDGTSMEQILDEILEIYLANSKFPPIYPEQLLKFDKLRSRIVYKLIHSKSNETLLTHIPHIPYLDLSIVFYILLEENEYGHMTALIHTTNMESWDITIEELYALAAANTPVLLPADIKNMTEVMKELAKERLGDEYREELMEQLFTADVRPPLYVLSNLPGLCGSSTILYEGVLKNFADSLKQDLVILPSSIHEVLLVPYEEELCLEELSDMVLHINKTEVPAEDKLSDEIYFYSRSLNQVTLASPAAMAEHLS